MGKIPIAIQLYSIREDCKNDLPGTLAKVKKMGYDGVDFAGWHGYSAKELKTMLSDIGLLCAGAHIPQNDVFTDDIEKAIEFHLELGNKYLIVPGLSEDRRNSIAAWKESAEMFNNAVEKLNKHGLLTGYHNHFHEFSDMEGEIPWHVFAKNTRKEVVLQFDTGNAMHGGADPMAFLTPYPGRAVTVHLKEWSAGYDQAVIGEGQVPWKEVFSFCETEGGTEWYIVEQENYSLPPLECVEKCLINLRNMGI